MATTSKSHTRSVTVGTNFETDVTAVGATDSVKLCGALAVQVTGVATDFAALVERSTRDPALGSPNWSVIGDAISGNPAAGIPATAYNEPSAAWWRLRVTALSGASAVVSISGGYAA